MESVALQRVARAVLILLGLCTAIASGDEPEWVRKRPISQEFYVGIGMARKDRPAAEYTEGARNVALNDIASQITVSISSDVLRTVLEKNEQLEDEFQSRIRASTTAELEGVQLVDTYETDEEYWVYCRLSRSDYEARRAGKLNAAATQSLDLYTRGRQAEREGKTGLALGLYGQAFGPIEKYLAEPLVVQSEGRSVYLVNEVYTSLRTLLNQHRDQHDRGRAGREDRTSAPEASGTEGDPEGFRVVTGLADSVQVHVHPRVRRMCRPGPDGQPGDRTMRCPEDHRFRQNPGDRGEPGPALAGRR